MSAGNQDRFSNHRPFKTTCVNSRKVLISNMKTQILQHGYMQKPMGLIEKKKLCANVAQIKSEKN